MIDNHQNIMIIGGSSSAKTHLAIGLAFTAIERNYRVRFYTLNELASQLLNAKTHNYESKFIDSVKRFHLIVVDELGYVPIKVDARFLLFEVFVNIISGLIAYCFKPRKPAIKPNKLKTQKLLLTSN
ncbi:ATP-binding protein [Candidatus Tisiphia endosymbiont of Metellina segmentata]|uniref:ATP-binding protein n=1 Tax=Candidatus Tisiphia endosymbiont of Metellina segmentata TaxID=3066274 RepID=UPI00313D614B